MKQTDVEVHHLSPTVAVCQTFGGAVKADLYSSALTTAAGTFLIDPFATSDDMLADLTNGRGVTAILVTNENHLRASGEIARRLGVRVYADPAATVPDSEDICALQSDLAVVAIPGAPSGEIALHSRADGGTIIIGDALINFGSHGFSLLPGKYCSDAKLMRESLRQLVPLSFTRMLFAHGMPILTNARERLAALLESEK